MSQKTKNVLNQGSNDLKNGFFGSVPKSHTQMVCLVQKMRAKNAHAWSPLTITLIKKEYILMNEFNSIR
jgi:hypothetical protein